MNPTSSLQNQQDKVKVVAGYALQQELGSGSFATVYRGVRLPDTKADADTVAIKAISRTSKKLTKKVLQNLEIEISILRTYRHPNIVCLHNVQKTERHFYLILEYCGGGDLQQLIHSRKAGRLSERLTRRLVRDLASGLRFLWSQELIHRDIKPQNLLLTGRLPLDEVNDPEQTDEHEHIRQQTNFPSTEFALKIADFGFARHLHTTSLAETLCGSPLYMAPEILQHHRYDAKADLWSVGTVLFEMMCGRPPFHGANHIDLLRNIQRKEVRLPADVRVSKECINLLRLLLNRNPLSRAGFKEFFKACDAFVALGCNGTGTPRDDLNSNEPRIVDLGPIPENDGGSTSSLSESLHTVTTTASHPQCHQYTDQSSDSSRFVQTADKGATPAPQAAATLAKPVPLQPYGGLTPLVPSPPFTSTSPTQNVPALLAPPTLSSTGQPTHIGDSQHRNRRDGTSSAENSFVMVEHVASLQPTSGNYSNIVPQDSSQPAYVVPRGSISAARSDYMVANQAKGMLSTSPGTGGALLGMLSGRNRLMQTPPPGTQVEIHLSGSTKILAAAEDVGRRAICVAHLGDSRAYAGMRMVQLNEACSSSLLSTTPMEGITEETTDNGAVTDDSDSTEIMTVARRRRSSATDKSMADVHGNDELGEMPFAINAETSPLVEANTMPTRENSTFTKGASITSAKPTPKPTVAAIRTHYQEALSCYLKTLKMLKSSICAAQRVAKELEVWCTSRPSGEQQVIIDKSRRRCAVTSAWLSDQFNGVLERANAANVEIRKLPTQTSPDKTVSVEELIFNASMACGREGAVKHLLGQNEAARSSYRSAGLLAETLLMEPGLGVEDRKILEGYVDGFAARITELDQAKLQQSRMAISGAAGSGNASRRAPSVIGLVGGSPLSMNFTPSQL